MSDDLERDAQNLYIRAVEAQAFTQHEALGSALRIIHAWRTNAVRVENEGETRRIVDIHDGPELERLLDRLMQVYRGYMTATLAQTAAEMEETE